MKEKDLDYRIGFACKFYESSQDLNFRTIRAKTLDNIHQYSKKVDLVLSVLEHNVSALNNQIEEILKWPKKLWMLRIGSDIFPLYTHKEYGKIYSENHIKSVLLSLERIGEKIRKNNIRISMHPGQFTMLVSKNNKTVINSIEDLEYHADVFRYMNIDPNDQKNEINIHVGARVDNFEEIFLNNFNKLSEDLKKWLSIENDEFSYGIFDILKFSETTKIIFDIHHHWVMYNEYLSPDNEIMKKIILSWRGARPEIHYSLPKEKYIKEEFAKNPLKEKDVGLSNFRNLFTTNNKKKLREHSLYCWSNVLNEYIMKFLDRFDIMVEAKAKQKASNQLFHYVENNIGSFYQ
ncbi:MAG: hypothetical protein QXF12_08360 [Candidatus Aenigmatarchaeota archaeon]